MSLYNMIFGVNKLSPMILATLNLSPDDFGRFRNCFVADGKIAVYTRCGGGNRDDYVHIFDAMQAHPLFLEDVDDDFDSTYCTFFFSYPEAFAEDLRKIESKEPFEPGKQWSELFARLDAEKAEQNKTVTP
jgi:hypothetical protein